MHYFKSTLREDLRRIGGGTGLQTSGLGKKQDMQDRKQAYMHLNWQLGYDPAPWQESNSERTWEKRVSPGALQGGQVGALSGHLARQGEELHPPQ